MKKSNDNTPAQPIDALFKGWRKDPKYREAYDAAAPEYGLYAAMLQAMADAHLTQKEVAKRMHTSEAAVSRLFDMKKKHAPSWKTIMKFAQAVGKMPVLHFVDAGR